MRTLLRAVDLGRTLRSQAGLKVRQPLATLWLALPDGTLGEGLDAAETPALLELLSDELNVKAIELIGDESELVERRVKPLLPVIGRKYGAAGAPDHGRGTGQRRADPPDGSVTLGGVTLAPDEVEILATPRPGTAVAHDEGVVVVIDTSLTPELRAEGDAREVTRAIQDLRKQAELDLDAEIELWIVADAAVGQPGAARADDRGRDARRGDHVGTSRRPSVSAVTVALDGGEVRIALRPRSPRGGSVA